VKYHLGTSTDVEIGGRTVHLSLQPNPSHLEAVDPVVVGKVRARQDMAGDTKTRRTVMGIQLHGDAAFAGQGVVYETLAMSQLIGYRTGGSIHIITNNQIGFTTVPAHAYSGLYCTDVAKSIQVPILHVNGDDPEAVVFCARMAAEFRMTFGADIVLDIVCYRRHGHNETDEPPSPSRSCTAGSRRRRRRGPSTPSVSRRRDRCRPRSRRRCSTPSTRRSRTPSRPRPPSSRTRPTGWKATGPASRAVTVGEEVERLHETAVGLDALREVGAALTRVPAGFNANPKILRQLEAKKQAIEGGEGIDWATGEALAFGTLLLEGHRVRLSGEDVQRGTFSHRHAYLVDQKTQAEYVPLNNIRSGQPKFEAFNSLLSEFGVLGFEYGYTLADPRTLVPVGGAVRRLRERRAGDHRPVHRIRRDQVAAHVGPGDAAAAWL
jgi:2-oxoglutarate dehydrogenase E1 component